MFGLTGPLGTIVDLLTVMVGFGFIVFIHELGHFVAARWAGIRVLTFAIGFGPPLVSWRKGVGFRKGSSLAAYNESQKRANASDVLKGGSAGKLVAAGVSPTEYRLSALPFGGYVQMLGQDDTDPGAVSDAPDSYQNAPVWKRMIVISAGVVMNVILAAVLFVFVFMAGLAVQPPVVGAVGPDSAAARAVVVDESGEPVAGASAGLETGDAVRTIDGARVRRFDSIAMRAAMAEAGRPMELVVDRPGVADPLAFRLTPEKSEMTGLLELGIAPPFSTRLAVPDREADRELMAQDLARMGLGGLEPGDEITAANGEPVSRYSELAEAFENSGGAAVTMTLLRGEATVEVVAEPRAEMERAQVVGPETGPVLVEHLLGLVPVMRVSDYGEPEQGLANGDVFARIGSVEFPSFAAGLSEIRATSGKPIELVVLRRGAGGDVEEVTIPARVKRNGMVGFLPDVTTYESTLLAMPPASLTPVGGDGALPSPAAGLVSRAGAVIVSVDGEAVSDLGDVRAALLSATADERASEAERATVEVGLAFPHAMGDAGQTRTVAWTLDRSALDRLGALGWGLPLPRAYVEPEEVLLKAEGPAAAVGLGITETHRVMTSVYVTFLRLTQGSLQVEHIKGPVGIAHVGTIIADRGVIWVMFFLGLISVNLAVVNFLPLPIVDGGQFLMLLYEQIRGKPVPIPVQNAVMMAGMLLIVGVFLFVTFNDIRALLGG